MSDDPDVATDGTWILAIDGAWHHSVEFDGFEHGTACGESFDARDEIRQVEYDQPTDSTLPTCSDCDPDVATDGGPVGVDRDDVPDTCTTRLCDGDPEWAVRFHEDVSRRLAPPPGEKRPPEGSVCPYVCDDCRADEKLYPTIEEDRWVRVAEAIADGGTAASAESPRECCGVRIVAGDCPICQEPLVAALDHLKQIDKGALDAMTDHRLRAAESNIMCLLERGHADCRRHVWEFLLGDAGEKLARAGGAIEADDAVHHVREAHQILAMVAANGGGA